MFGDFYRKNRSKVRISLVLVAAMGVTLFAPEGVIGKKIRGSEVQAVSDKSEERIVHQDATSTDAPEGGVFRGVVEAGEIVEV